MQLVGEQGCGDLVALLMGQGAAWGDTSVPGMAQMLQDVQTYEPSEQPNGYFEFGYAEAIVAAAILKKAADNHDLVSWRWT
jgi:ABC-type phosphate transport system substrate-binding protein